MPYTDAEIHQQNERLRKKVRDEGKTGIVFPNTKAAFLLMVRNALMQLGMGRSNANYSIAQIALETNDLNSHLIKDDNNLSGIMFINKPGIQKNAVRGSKRPASEGGNYARYNTVKDWAVDYIRILKSGPGQPYAATSLSDFANRLAANGYWDVKRVPIPRYLAGLTRYYDKYIIPKGPEAVMTYPGDTRSTAQRLADYYKQNPDKSLRTDVPGKGPGWFETWWNSLKDWQKMLAAAVLGLALSNTFGKR